MPDVQTFMTLKRRSHFATFREIMENHGIEADPVDGAADSVNLSPGIELFMLRAKTELSCGHEGCQCVGALGKQILTAIHKEKLDHEKKGWSKSKIDRWLATVEKDRGYEYEVEDRKRWAQWLRDLMASGSVDEIGLLSHESVHGPQGVGLIANAKRITIPIRQLTVELLDEMEREVLYLFIPEQ